GQVPFERKLREKRSLRQRRTPLAERTFPRVWIQGEESLSENKLQDSVAEKLEPLVALLFLGALLEERRMRQRADQQPRVTKPVANLFQQGIQCRHIHRHLSQTRRRPGGKRGVCGVFLNRR